MKHENRKSPKLILGLIIANFIFIILNIILEFEIINEFGIGFWLRILSIIFMIIAMILSILEIRKKE